MSMCFIFIYVIINCIMPNYGFTVDHTLKLSKRLNTMLQAPKPEYRLKLTKHLNLYAGVLSYIILKTEDVSLDLKVKNLYSTGKPEFLKIPVKEKRLAFKNVFQWNDRELDLFLEEFDHTKKLWVEFENQVKTKEGERHPQ